MSRLHLPRNVLIPLPGGFPYSFTVEGEFVPIDFSALVEAHFRPLPTKVLARCSRYFSPGRYRSRMYLARFARNSALEAWNFCLHAGHFGTFEIGAKVRNAHKFQDAFDPAYNVDPSVTPLAMTQFLGSFTNSNYYGKSYTLGPTVDYN